MGRFDDVPVSRRKLLLAGLALGVPAIVTACSSGGGGDRATRRPRATTGSPAGSATSLAPTPACGDNAEATKSQTEGPFYEANSPEKSNFVGDVDKGTKIVLTGTVLTTACQPVQRALLDVWQADDFKVQPPGGKLLTTQLYFPGEPRNERDSIFRPELLMDVRDGADGKDAAFNFVVV